MKSIFKDKNGNLLSWGEALSKVLTRFYNYFLDFELMLLRCVGFIPFHSIRRFFYKLAGVKIGKGSTIHMGARFFQPKNIIVGDDTVIGDGSFMDGKAKLSIGSHTERSKE